MAIFYSASTGGFYDETIGYTPGAIPADAVEITPARHAELLAAQKAGRKIMTNDSGRPVLARGPSAEQQRAALVNAIKAEARRRIEAVSPPWRQLNDSREPSPAGAARFAAIDALRAASDRIEQQLQATPAADLATFDISTNPHWDA
ncbi:hypothetical protein GRI97_15815 [Altererythrobacter xixiisoli]|uniref:Uncharacterized protein n=1 Tax=Croceibacterium xixiisoli TaxID=1476466 RepID=A0A6I4U0H7_9SPHN|nr:hypothetical protein [Croceibacterium xixiisoli]MXP00458.1 hypothetical protein [Croceibacterium xixiisoli]